MNDKTGPWGGTRPFHPSAQNDEAVELMVRLLDLQDGALPIRRLRDWGIAALEPRPGEVAVDVGCGTGTVLRELGALVGGDGHVTGVEPNPKLRAVAEQRAAGDPVVDLVDALADALPFAGASVDVLWCERVLQHLEDAQAAVDEFARVLKPGGRAVLLDSDHATRVTSDIDLDVEARINAAFNARTANPRAARHIPRQALTAGFEVDSDIASAALIIPSDLIDRASWLAMAAQLAVQDEVVTEIEADRAVRAHWVAAERGYAFSAVTVFGFLLRKP